MIDLTTQLEKFPIFFTCCKFQPQKASGACTTAVHGRHSVFRGSSSSKVIQFWEKLFDFCILLLYLKRPEPETIKIFPDCNRTINDCNSTVKVLDGPVTVYTNFYSFGLRRKYREALSSHCVRKSGKVKFSFLSSAGVFREGQRPLSINHYFLSDVFRSQTVFNFRPDTCSRYF